MRSNTLLPLLILVCSALWSSCTLHETTDKNITITGRLNQYLQRKFNQELPSNVQKIYILTGDGCITCNIKFNELIREAIDDPTSLIIINASPNAIDLSAYIDERPNVFIDNKKYSNGDSIVNTTKFILTNAAQPDTVLYFGNAKFLFEQLDYVQQFINK